jgi:dTDP-4-dehydrorhamnose reductase
MKTVAVIGKNSYLAHHFLATPTGTETRALSHDELGDMALPETGCIVNFAYPWAYMTDAYAPENDFERTIVERIKDSDIHLVMFSSRKVYDREAPGPLNENSALAGQSHYGDNKIITEDLVRKALPGRHTILRLGNIIERESGRHTFLGIALETLKRNGRIELDVAPETKRDFLPLTHFAAALEKIVRERPVGVFNLASGLETAVGDVASWIVEGFSSGDVVSSDVAIKDTFVLDVSRLQSIIGPVCDYDDIRQACLESGRKLKNG